MAFFAAEEAEKVSFSIFSLHCGRSQESREWEWLLGEQIQLLFPWGYLMSKIPLGPQVSKQEILCLYFVTTILVSRSTLTERCTHKVDSSVPIFRWGFIFWKKAYITFFTINNVNNILTFINAFSQYILGIIYVIVIRVCGSRCWWFRGG